MNFPKTSELETEHLLLRRFREEDGEGFYRNVQKYPEVYDYMPDFRWAELAEQSASYCRMRIPYYELPYFFDWVITDKNNGEVIGEINASYSHKRKRASVGYCLGPEYWNRGLMSEALRTVTEFLENCPEIDHVEAECRYDNDASRRVLEKCGYVMYKYLPDTRIYVYRKPKR